MAYCPYFSGSDLRAVVPCCAVVKPLGVRPGCMGQLVPRTTTSVGAACEHGHGSPDILRVTATTVTSVIRPSKRCACNAATTLFPTPPLPCKRCRLFLPSNALPANQLIVIPINRTTVGHRRVVKYGQAIRKPSLHFGRWWIRRRLVGRPPDPQCSTMAAKTGERYTAPRRAAKRDPRHRPRVPAVKYLPNRFLIPRHLNPVPPAIAALVDRFTGSPPDSLHGWFFRGIALIHLAYSLDPAQRVLPPSPKRQPLPHGTS